MCFKKSNLKIDQILKKAAQWVKDKKGNRTNLALTKDGNVGIGTLNPEEMLEVEGTVKAAAFTGDGSGLTGIKHPGLPRGMIVMWHGNPEEIPQGWALCDGTKGTPDLQDRFICGTSGVPGEEGGNNSITLTEANLPPHTHSCGDGGEHSHQGNCLSAGGHQHTGSAANAGNHSHSQGPTAGVGDHTHGFYGVRLYSSAEAAGTIHGWEGAGRETDRAGRHSHANPNTNPGGDHSHTLTLSSGGEHGHQVEITGAEVHGHELEKTGEGEAIDIRPLFYKMAFIMKL